MADYGSNRVETTVLGGEELLLLSRLEVVEWLNEATSKWAIQEPHKGNLRRLLIRFEDYAWGHLALTHLSFLDDRGLDIPDKTLGNVSDLLTEGLLVALKRDYEAAEDSVVLALAVIRHELSEMPENLRPPFVELEVQKALE